ncbi:hypothetical protein IFM89_027513 [Coptis chinensis]|uniref:Uncharacterized protein n=1 Tax=Coptis chinensis TaxID=261450 RepID=A0A835M1Z3_9MAGN|nr:hypothetical protein IFM89_027513 [Coptis chinensis]
MPDEGSKVCVEAALAEINRGSWFQACIGMLGTPVLFLSGTRDYRAALCMFRQFLHCLPEVESDATKGVLYFRQSLLLLRLNCPEVALSLQLARHNAASEHERLVYEGWILYDTSHCEEGLRKAKGINQP